MQQPPGYPPPQGYPPPGYPPQHPGWGQPPPPPQPPQRKGMSAAGIVLLTLVGVAVLGIGSCVLCVGVGAVATQNASNAASKPAPGKDDPATPVEIKVLLSEYKGNELRADGTFKGKVIRTSGIVRDVKKDITGDPYVVLGTGGMLEIPSVQCFLADDQASAASSLSAGERVTIEGRVDGLLMNVLVKDCVIDR